MVYFASFHSVLNYGIIFLGNSTNIGHVFTLRERIITISLMYGPTAHVDICSINYVFYPSYVITYYIWRCL